jgi:hypothetical protein
VSYQFDYSYASGIWHLAYTPLSPAGYPDPQYTLPGVVPEGDWTLYADVFGVSDGGAVGLVVMCEDEAVSLLGSWNSQQPSEPQTYVVEYSGLIQLRMRYISSDSTLELSALTTGSWEVLDLRVITTPLDTGLILRYDNDSATMVEGFMSNVILLPTADDVDAHTDLLLAPTQFNAPPVVQPLVTLGNEPTVYAMIGAPFGDLELDIGKSARWLEYFSDKLFALDVNMGDPRYWIINWTKTFPDSDHAVTNINYFADPVRFRKEQFARADAMYHMSDTSWIMFIDGTEGLSFDNASLPNDYASNPFMSFIYREITRAEDASQTSVVLPFFVFLRSGEVQNVTYDHPSNDPSGDIPPVLQPISVPYYLPYQGLRRLFRVDVLRQPSFDWTSLDQPATPSSGVKAQIVSYAYAHWQMLDIPPGATVVPPLSVANDDGFRMRKMISQVRPIASLPAQAWDPAADPAGVPGPWAAYILTNTNPDFAPITDSPVTPPAAAALGIKTPLYDTVLRLNLRDGVWYEGADTLDGSDVSGNTPLTWDSVNEKWITPYDPDVWPSTGRDGGINAPANPDFVTPPTPV